MRSLPRGLVVILAAACMTGCATTVKDTWKDPTVSQQSMQFKKVLVMAMMPDEASRRIAEDEMVSRLRMPAVASYTMLSDADLKNVEAANRKFKEEGFDGAIIMRMLGEEEQVSYEPGSYPGYYNSFYGYYGYARRVAYAPAYLETDVIVYVETNIYSLEEDKLLWSGLSQTYNPKNQTELLDDVVGATIHKLQKQGLIPKEKGGPKKAPPSTSTSSTT
ncbi:MAG: hypothetical protein ACREAA_06770 [Candidatus Polarisedimenticolia bacterium]